MSTILYGNLRAEIVRNAGARVQRVASGKLWLICSPPANLGRRGNP